MSLNNYRITGRVVDQKSGQGVPHLHVEAWDKEGIIHDRVGSADTLADGSFTLQFDQTYVDALFKNRQTDIYFKVSGDSGTVTIVGSPIWSADAPTRPVTITVNVAPAAGLLPGVISRFLGRGPGGTGVGVGVGDTGNGDTGNGGGIVAGGAGGHGGSSGGAGVGGVTVGLPPQGNGGGAGTGSISVGLPPQGNGGGTGAGGPGGDGGPGGGGNGGHGGGGGATGIVSGSVTSATRAGVGGLTVNVIDRNVGADVPLATAVTALDGSYVAPYAFDPASANGKALPDLQAQVYSGQTLVGVSTVLYNAGVRARLNVLLTDRGASVLPSEHETLTAAIKPHYSGALGALREDAQQQDITYLANKTGWDARAIALAALADKFAPPDSAGGALTSAHFYALLRCGLPTDPVMLCRTNTRVVESTLKQAVAKGVIPSALASGIPAAVEAFRAMASKTLLSAPALVGVSKLQDVAAVSLGADLGKQQTLADLCTKHPNGSAEFWNAASAAFGAAAAARLKVDGKLAFLTLNNAPLMQKLHAPHAPNGITDTAMLVDDGFHAADRWLKEIGSDPIPPTVPGADDASKRRNYAEMLAAHVRLSHPTAVVGLMVQSGATPLLVDSLRPQVHAFLAAHRDTFRLGAHPVGQYVKRNGLTVAPEVLKELSRIQRAWQITPSHDAMNAVLSKGVDSAYAAVRYTRDEFVAAFKDAVGGESSAALIHAKSQLVHNAVLNVALSYITASKAAPIGVHSPAQIVDPVPAGADPNATDVIAYPTLESLMGGMDYCECAECRSILSPAAYLVDLLNFIDRPSVQTGSNPQDVLLVDRRPDIANLPLTCENTNTPLPYIDLVNETLEYYVASKDPNGAPLSPRMSLSGYTGHTTDPDADPAELQASPTFVTDSAYTILDAATFPAPLPFHQPLESLRRYFDKSEAPLSQVMESLRKDDSLERANAGEYAWRDILMEELRLSRAEHVLLTDSTITLQQLYGYPVSTTHDAMMADLMNVETYAKRMGVAYVDMAEIVKTRFVNPNAALIPKLAKLGVPFTTLQQYKNGGLTDVQFGGMIAQGLDASQYGGDIGKWVKSNYAQIMGLLTLSDPNAPDQPSAFANLEFRYADPNAGSNKARDFEFVRLLRFIRLWKKLGWTVAQTDKAVAALYPAAQVPNDASDAVNLTRLDAGFKTLLPRLGIVKRVMDRLGLDPDADLLSLLACFAPLDTLGPDSLYAKMFLSPAALRQNPVFADDGYGNFLAGSATVLDPANTASLRAAFQLTADEFVQITTALGYDANTLLYLTKVQNGVVVDNVTPIFRRGWLARKLQISVKELLLLTKFSAIDPFAAPDPVAPPILQLIDLVSRLSSVGLAPSTALYLIWNQDLSGDSAPAGSAVLDFARTLRADLAAIETQFSVVTDPDGKIARARMALVYGGDVTDAFFGLLNRTTDTDVAYSAAPQTSLDPSILGVSVQGVPVLAPGELVYDDLRKLLSYTKGVMPTATRDALKGAQAATQPFKDAVDKLCTKTGAFFVQYPELQSYHDSYIAAAGADDKKRSALTALLAKILPLLKDGRKRQQTLQAMGGVAQVDPPFVRAVLRDATVLHAAADKTKAALDDLLAVQTLGLSAAFYYADTVAANAKPDKTSRVETDLQYGAPNGPALPPNANDPTKAVSGVWSGFLQVPQSGDFGFRIDTDAKSVTLTIDGATVALSASNGSWTNTSAVALDAGSLHQVSLKVEAVKTALSVYWQTTGVCWEIVPAAGLYPDALLADFTATYTRFLKAASLATALKLTAEETAFLARYFGFKIFADGWLNVLAVAADPDPSTWSTLRDVLLGVTNFAEMKAALSPSDERLLTVLEDSVAASARADGPLFALTRWDQPSLTVLLTRFGRQPVALQDLNTFRKVYDAFGWMRKLGVSAAALQSAVTNDPTAAVTRAFQAALRARYQERDWLQVIRPINDEMRRLQRDALVAFILQGMSLDPKAKHIDTADKLYEYLLMDVLMEPATLTSRVRFALSSVQLFIERCILNLEPRVAPASIDVAQWAWMSRYRVWEANRKVFLWPENWLEPELRDDQSPIFKETMSELLQKDITDDAATTAMLNYLSKLEEVAKLEPLGIHHVENAPDDLKGDVDHVIARSPGGTRKYFYRRREYGYWTPWEQVKLEIEDAPVVPFVWNDRLFLFWLKIIKSAALDADSMPSDSGSGATGSAGKASDLPLDSLIGATKSMAKKTTKLAVKAALCYSEYYNGKWQPMKTSDVNAPVLLGMYSQSGFDRTQATLCPEAAGRLLHVAIKAPPGGGILDAPSDFYLYNTHSLPVRAQDIVAPPAGVATDEVRLLKASGSDLSVEYISRDVDVTPDVLKNTFGGNERTVAPTHPLKDPWNAPFFLEDSHHAFYVTTQAQIVTLVEWTNYAPGIDLGQQPSQQATLVQEGVPMTGPSYGIDTSRLPGYGVVDPSPIESVLLEGGNIKNAIGAVGNVRYNGTEIGLTGGLARTAAAMVMVGAETAAAGR